MALAGLWSIWKNPKTNGILKTFTIVTSKANPLMSKIHNNPKLEGARMPCILNDSSEDLWLQSIENDADIQNHQNLIQPYPEDQLKAFTVNKLRGKGYLGNVEEVTHKIVYQDLEF